MLEVKNICKSFGEKVILSDFSFSFENGIYLIVGESGIGKTTLLNIIAGLDNDFSGEVIGGGIENVSYAFQEYRLLPGISALENVALAHKGEGDSVIAARNILARLGFSESDMRLSSNKLSGGMKQRVSLARAFIKKAPVLLLDEPTKELNSELVEIILKIVESISKDTIVLLVTHDNLFFPDTTPIKISL